MKTPLPTGKGLSAPPTALLQGPGPESRGPAPAATSSPGSPSAGWARAGSPPPCLLPSPPRRPAPLTPSRQTFSSLRAMVGQAAPSPSAGDAAQNDHSPFPARQTDTRTGHTDSPTPARAAPRSPPLSYGRISPLSRRGPAAILGGPSAVT